MEQNAEENEDCELVAYHYKHQKIISYSEYQSININPDKELSLSTYNIVSLNDIPFNCFAKDIGKTFAELSKSFSSTL